ncbi:MAG: 50S ribosomal protein L6 [Myxococcota bacterium]|jgi:large subunit ribosomal protein L6
MSRVGRKPVAIPSGVNVTHKDGVIEVKGPRGTLREALNVRVSVEVAKSEVSFGRPDDLPPTRALHGLARATVQNMVVGVTQGFSRELEIQGTGYRAEVRGKNLNLTVGFSHPVAMPIPEGLKVTVAENRIKIEGASRHDVGQFASNVREVRPPEPYKGKGIRYVDEQVRRKVGKAAAG